MWGAKCEQKKGRPRNETAPLALPALVGSSPGKESKKPRLPAMLPRTRLRNGKSAGCGEFDAGLATFVQVHHGEGLRPNELESVPSLAAKTHEVLPPQIHAVALFVL